jgi:hypothetical protein
VYNDGTKETAASRQPLVASSLQTGTGAQAQLPLPARGLQLLRYFLQALSAVRELTDTAASYTVPARLALSKGCRGQSGRNVELTILFHLVTILDTRYLHSRIRLNSIHRRIRICQRALRITHHCASP